MSQTDRILLFAFSHQVVIIEIIFAVMLGIVVVWLFTHLRGESEDSTAGREHQIDDIKEALKRVLETTDLKMTTAAQAVNSIRDEDDEKFPLPTTTTIPAAGAGGKSSAGGDPADVTKLRQESELRALRLAELEKALALAKEDLQKAKNSPALPGGQDSNELLQKIKSLESRLSEYEIIEDDIANLSLYKEENVKLKSELERFKIGQSGAPSAETAAPLSAPAPAAGGAPTAQAPAQAPVPAIAKPSASAEMASETVVAGTNPAPSASPAEKEIDSEKLLQEFDALISSEKTAAPAKPVAEKKIVEEKKPVEEKKIVDEKKTADNSSDLIQEFEKFVKGGQ